MDASLSSLFSATGADAADQSVAGLFGSLYAELHRIAKRELARRGPSGLGATTLLHEAYLDMARRAGPAFPDEARFMSYTARVMRGLIIDHARSGQASKRGGEFHMTTLSDDTPGDAVDAGALSALSDALDALAKVDPPLAQVVDLKFFCGFSFAEIAAMQGASERTVQRKWERARIYLHRTLRSDPPL